MPAITRRIAARLEALEVDLKARSLGADADRYLRRQARSRRRLADAIAAWARLSHAEDTAGEAMPVTRVDAVNAAGTAVTITITATITPTEETTP